MPAEHPPQKKKKNIKLDSLLFYISLIHLTLGKKVVKQHVQLQTKQQPRCHRVNNFINIHNSSSAEMLNDPIKILHTETER